MTCKDFEARIYLYPELTIAERQVVEAHMHHCEACRQLFSIAQQAQLLLADARSAKPQPENVSLLTSNIMQAVYAPQNQPASWMSSSFLRYTMVAVSLILVVWFANEQQSSVELPHRAVLVDAVMLKSQSVSTILNQKKEKTESLYACAKSENCNNTFILTLKQRF